MLHKNIDPINARGEQALADRKAAEQAGHAFGEDPMYAYGTELIDAGKDNWHEQRRNHFEQALTSEVMSKVRSTVSDQFRTDAVVSISDLRFTPEFKLSNGFGLDVSMTDRSFRQLLCSRAGAPSQAATYLPMIPADIARLAANHHLATSTDKVMLRSRLDGDRRTVYAALGASFPRFDVDQVADVLGRAVHPTSRGRAIIDGAKWELVADFIKDEVPVVGDIFHAKISVRGADDGTSAIEPSIILEQARCVNLTRISSIKSSRIVHSGKMQTVADRVQDAITQGYETVRSFVERWALAAQTEIIDSAYELGARQVFAVLLANGHVSRPDGWTSEQFVDACVRSYGDVESEYGLTQRGISYALTKAAQQLSPWSASVVEEQAGQLLYNFVTINDREYDNAVSRSKDSDFAKVLEIN